MTIEFPTHRLCSFDRFLRSVELAEQIRDLGFPLLRVFYDDYEDYVKIVFLVNSQEYYIRSYKLHAVVRTSDQTCERRFHWLGDFYLLNYLKKLRQHDSP